MCLVMTYSEILPLAKQTADSIVEEFIFSVFWRHQHFLKHQILTVRKCVFQVKNEFLTSFCPLVIKYTNIVQCLGFQNDIYIYYLGCLWT